MVGGVNGRFHKRAQPLPTFDQPLIQQHAQRLAHRASADAKRLHQPLFRGQLVILTELANRDFVPQLGRNLKIFG